MEKRNKATRFLICGAGIAGSVLGVELLRRGFRVVIWEKQEKIGRQVCGEYLTPEGVKLVESFDSHNDLNLLAGFSKLQGMNLISPDGRMVTTTFPEGRWGVSLNRKIFIERILKEFARLGGEIHYGRTLESLRLSKNSIFANDAFEFDYLIGADGRQSKVAKLLSSEQDDRSEGRKRVAIHTYLSSKFAFNQRGQMHIFGEGSYLGINPIEAQAVNVSIVLDGAVLKSFNSPRACLEHYILNSPKLSAMFDSETIGEVRVVFPIGKRDGKIDERLGCLIGDAAGFIDPLTGEGITTALKTVRILLNNLDLYGPGERAFSSYVCDRKKILRQKRNINFAFQSLIRHPRLCNVVSLILSRSEFLANLFIGVVGNIYTPGEFISTWIHHYQEKRYE